MDRRLFPLMVCRIPGLSPLERAKILEERAGEFDKGAALGVLSTGEISGLLGRKLPDWKEEALSAQAERDMGVMDRLGIGVAELSAPDYPPLLREIYDPPALLFYRGRLPPQDRPMAALVGTRRPSSGALAEAFRIGRGLAEAGIPVVSGLALGIDAMAHRGCVEGGGIAAAVLGSGLDEVYPSSNRNLAGRIIEGGGCLLSEYPPGTPPYKGHFPARNRIISALSRGVLVVEAPLKSGALITARCALEQGRDLWVGAAGLASPRGEGTRKLSQDGAKTVSQAEDILREWNEV